jgi:hypothetical protein
MIKYNDNINMQIVNMRVNKNPLVLVNTLFKVSKAKTDVEGYWLDNGKVYKDYIIPVSYPAIDSYYFRLAVQELLKSGELCVFSKNFRNEGVLEWKSGKEEIIKERYEEISESRPDKEYIKILLEEFGGLTLYKLAEDCYLIEAYNINI